MRKRWTLLPADEAAVAHLEEVLKIPTVLCRLLVQRGITTFDEAKAFFRPDLTFLHDPFLMQDMPEAVERLEQAVDSGEKILLYGDYDVDGVTCVAMMYSFLKNLFPDSPSLGGGWGEAVYIPDRYREGYGVSRAGIDYAKANGQTLIIAMDCGIRAVEQVAYAKSLGIDFIICDHHLPASPAEKPDGQMPNAVAILDPMRPDCEYPFKGLSGCGVAFKLAQAFTEKRNLPEGELHALLDLLVLSIAADIVPMTGENRTLAYFGLQLLNQTKRIGLHALIEQSGRQRPLTISDVVFGLAPQINAAGRLGDAREAVRLLLSNEKKEASDLARKLSQRNEIRKEHDRNILREAAEQFQAMPDWEQRKSILLFQEDWHKGVVGIAAARMVEQFHRPTILLTQSNGMATGSARSVRGFNVYQAIRQCEGLLTNFGGHDHAAGMTLPVDAVPEFQRQFEAAVSQTITPEQQVPEVLISAPLNFEDITPKFWRILKQFAPFGPGNRSPVFATKNVVDTGNSRLLKGNHLRVHVRQGSGLPMLGIAFGMGDFFSKISSKKPFHVAYKIQEEEWRGERTLRMVVRDIWA